ncbi:hypothetical protein Pint_24081 [Pistacia integerrima]|uniref:Uncharacterized protein n=1 Tax=Pistacia integerrima TaxID=434235 RepID=A0ACC0YLN1_9ROSI|nr:hypothetical protein Pint_24081 [Pistacia integerrima]
MGVLSVFLSCFMPTSESSRVSDNNGDLGMKVSLQEKSKTKSKSSSSGAPLVVPYFPSATQLSRL